MSDVDYLTYLERQFDAAEHEDEPLRSGFVKAWLQNVSTRRPDSHEGAPDFARAGELLRPTSRLGPVFGLTQRDIDLSIDRLSHGRELSYSQEVAKRALDVVLALLALIPIAVVLPLIAVVMKIDSPGPVFFLQTRMGRGGKPFRMLKFRTMHVNAEEHLRALAAVSDGATASGLLFKLKRDPRITRFGKLLRQFSLDELPQYLNVISGSMSIVGPRPPLPSEMDARSPLRVKPGITGLWALAGRGPLSWEEALSLEAKYARTWSMKEDLSIIVKTVQILLEPRTAH